MSSYGDGARAIIGVQWKKGGGHVINVERQNGKTYYVDAQVGKRYNPTEVLSKAKPSSVTIVRTDNLKFTERAKKTLLQQKSDDINII